VGNTEFAWDRRKARANVARQVDFGQARNAG
jgi:hypothetical protein